MTDIKPFEISDEERQHIDAAIAMIVNRFEEIARQLAPAFKALGDRYARSLAPAIAFLRRLEEITAENRHAHRRDYRHRQIARRRRRR